MATWTWRTPVTDRTSSTDRMRYTDMIRITENINYLMEAARMRGYQVLGNEISKTVWEHNDIITRDQWTEILTSLDSVATGIFYEYEEDPNYYMTWRNINVVEDITFKCKNIIEQSIDMSRLNHWVGDPVFAADGSNNYGQEPILSGGSY